MAIFTFKAAGYLHSCETWSVTIALPFDLNIISAYFKWRLTDFILVSPEQLYLLDISSYFNLNVNYTTNCLVCQLDRGRFPDEQLVFLVRSSEEDRSARLTRIFAYLATAHLDYVNGILARHTIGLRADGSKAIVKLFLKKLKVGTYYRNSPIVLLLTLSIVGHKNT